MRFSHTLGLTTSLLAGVIASSSAMAQSAPAQAGAAPDQRPALEDIVVTARRRAEGIQNVPVSVSAIGSATLQTRGIRTEADLQLAIPGLVVRAGNNSNELNYVIRGESVDAYSGSPPGVQPYVDEVPLPLNSASAFFDLENVQAVKGPQGTLFGRNSTGGAVLFQTQQPKNEFGGYASVQYGNYDRLVTEGAINIPVIPDKLLVRFAGTVTSGGAYVRNLYDNKMLGDKNERAGRLTIEIRPIEGLTNITTVQINRTTGTNVPDVPYYAIPCGQDSGFNSCLYSPSVQAFQDLLAGKAMAGYPLGYVYAGGFQSLPDYLRSQGPYVVDDNTSFRHRASGQTVINKTLYELSSAITLKNIFGYSHSINKMNYDTDYTPYPIAQQYSQSAILSGGDLPAETSEVKTYSDEIQLQGKAADGRLNYLFGLFYIDSTEDYYSPLSISTIVEPDTVTDPVQVAYNARTGNKSYAVFGQATYKLTDALNLTVGGRYTWEKITLLQLAQSLYGAGQKQHATQSDPSWTVTLDYHLNRGLMVYVTTRGSWRRGGFNPFNPPTATNQTAATGSGGNYFLPEKIRDVEAGIKFDGRLADIPVRANLAVYNSWVSNIQKTAYVVVSGTASSATINVPRSKITGVEFDSSLQPLEWLRLGGSVTYTDARFTKSESIVFGLPVNYGPFGDTPRYSGTVYGDATLTLPDDIGTLVYHVDLYAQTHFYFSNLGGTIQPGTKLPGYALVNMRLDWADMFGKKVKASLFVKNLADKVYYTGGSAGAQNFSLEAAAWGMPRTYGVALRYDF